MADFRFPQDVQAVDDSVQITRARNLVESCVPVAMNTASNPVPSANSGRSRGYCSDLDAQGRHVLHRDPHMVGKPELGQGVGASCRQRGGENDDFMLLQASAYAAVSRRAGTTIATRCRWAPPSPGLGLQVCIVVISENRLMRRISTGPSRLAGYTLPGTARSTHDKTARQRDVLQMKIHGVLELPGTHKRHITVRLDAARHPAMHSAETPRSIDAILQVERI